MLERGVHCSYCNHYQKTKTNLKRVTCSSCGKKFPIKEKEIINTQKENKGGLNKVKLD